MTTLSYSNDDKDVVKKVIAQYGNKGTFAIDANDPLLVRFYAIQLALAGITPNNYPAFSRQWNDATRFKSSAGSLDQASVNGAVPVYSIVDINSLDGRNYTADALGSLPTQATNVTQTLGLFDSDANSVGAVNYTKSYINAADCHIQANGVYSRSPQENTENVAVIYTFAQTINQQTVFGAEVIASQSYPKEIINTSPTDLKHNSQIKICLTRESTDCDYWHDYNGVVSVPIKGQVTYLNNIDMSGGRPVNAWNAIYLIRTRAGGDPITPLSDVNVFNSPKTQINGNSISWDLDWLRFKTVDFQSGENVYYIFKMGVSAGGKNVASFITNAPKNVLPEQRFLNTFTIKPMQIVYGCLAKGTHITMQDGSQKNIESIVSGEWVLSQQQRYLRVEDVIRGNESDCRVIHFTSQHGAQSLTTSAGHPICTTSGIMLAKELTSQHRLITHEGESAIDAIETTTDEQVVYNLHLSTDDPLADGLEGRSTLYANGVLVGDSQMQWQYEEEYNQRPVNVLDQLPDEWRQDYQNYITVMGK
ncbi:hypothetical protein N7922_13495 [Kosakonia sp. ML.JS2a]|uniref:hypothetical protein n=1 Tax=Kosakonia sp. ML.JS2a TaxID=2980557 RepID=UPI0021DA3CAB|nr:hypothetical protein [Kosakonia sp. ML.JS2a]UXY08908.1 hypothetical protein N7922_13495 [Kosakonia sp. ML.JS2a]